MFVTKKRLLKIIDDAVNEILTERQLRYADALENIANERKRRRELADEQPTELMAKVEEARSAATEAQATADLALAQALSPSHQA